VYSGVCYRLFIIDTNSLGEFFSVNGLRISETAELLTKETRELQKINLSKFHSPKIPLSTMVSNPTPLEEKIVY